MAGEDESLAEDRQSVPNKLLPSGFSCAVKVNLSKYGIKEKYMPPLLLESWQRAQASARMASLQHPKDGPISAGAPFCALGAKKQSGLKSLSRPRKAKETKGGFLHSEVDQILSGGAGSVCLLLTQRCTRPWCTFSPLYLSWAGRVRVGKERVNCAPCHPSPGECQKLGDCQGCAKHFTSVC